MSRRRGRPTGFRLSDESKKAISTSKTGQRHKQETKDKISKSLVLYFRKKNPVSVELSSRYYRVMDNEAYDWLSEVESDIDSCMDFMTERAAKNKCKIEITCGNNIEYFSHDETPEFVLLLKEHCLINNIEIDDFIKEVESWE